MGRCPVYPDPSLLDERPLHFQKYIDEVYTAGIGAVLCKDDDRTRSDLSKKYGSGGLRSGMKYMISTTWNAPLEAFENDDQFFEGRGVDGVFMWLHKTYQFFGTEPLPTFSCYDVLKAPAIEDDLKRSRELEKDGILKRKIFAEIPPRVEYSITAKGETLSPIITSMKTWGMENMPKM